MTRDSFSLLPWGLTVFALFVALWYEFKARHWEARANYWLTRFTQGDVHVTEQQAVKIMHDLFPRPMGVPSAEQDAKAWRQRRALRGIDHKPSVVIDAENHAGNDSFAAKELLLLVLGGEETA